MPAPIEIRYEELKSLLKEKTTQETAKIMGVSIPTIYKYIKKYNISEYKTSRLSKESKEKLLDKEYVNKLLETHNRQEIADMFNTSIATITKYLEKNGIEKKFTHTKELPEILQDKNWLKNQIEAKSLNTISNETGIKISLIYRACKEHDLEVKNNRIVYDEKYNDKEWLQDQVNNKTCKELGEYFNVTPAAFFSQCKKLGIKIPLKGTINDRAKEYLEDKENLVENYVKDKKTIKEIASLLDVSTTTVSNYLKQYNIEIRIDEIHPLLQDKDWIENKLNNELRTPHEISKGLGVSHTTVLKNIKRQEVEYDIKRSHVPHESRKLLKSREWMEENYKKYTTIELGNILGCSSSHIKVILEGFGIERNIHRTQSAGEREVISHFPNENIITNSRELIPDRNTELDIYFPDYSFGVEYDGAYWHSKKDKNYHQEKKLQFKDNNINIMQIWDYEWEDPQKQDIIVSMIDNKLGNHEKIIRASKCSIVSLPSHKTEIFLNNNHIQGNTPASVRYGLVYENEIVAVMTFAKPRFTKKYDWEMIRFAVKKGHKVHGGASKLFKNFLREQHGSIISYCDFRYGTGKMYESLNFKYSHITSPNYIWTDGFSILKRYQTQKHKLPSLLGENFNPEETEKQNMEKNGFAQIFDSGNLVYAFTK